MQTTNEITVEITADLTIIRNESKTYNRTINKEELIDFCKVLNVNNVNNLKRVIYEYIRDCVADLIEVDYETLSRNEEYEIDDLLISNLDDIVSELTPYFEFEVKECCKVAPEYANYCPICGNYLK